MDVEFSIIVPVYNSEKTIRQCLESVKKQTIDNFEVLVINDGSSDHSGEICEGIAESDTRFKVIHQNNKGVSAARNRGIAIARGKYVAFVDSDDTVEQNYIESIIHEFAKSSSDIVFFGYNIFSPNGEKLGESSLGLRNKELELQIAELSKNNQFGFAWVKAFKREAIGDHKFDEEVSLFEDELFICSVLAECQSISIIPKPIYNYVKCNEGSLMGKTHQDYCELQDKVYNAWKKLVYNSRFYDQIIVARANQLAETLMYYFYERNIDDDLFLRAAGTCAYINECSLSSPFYAAIRNKNWRIAKLLKTFYLFKNKIRDILKH